MSGYCARCDPTLYRVWAVTAEWFDNPKRGSLEAVVAGRNVAAQIEKFLPGSVFVGVQPADTHTSEPVYTHTHHSQGSA